MGTQSLAVTIRVLMDEDISVSQCAALVWKEMKVGLAGGAFLGAARHPRHRSLSLVFKGYGFRSTPSQWPAAWGLALVIAMTISSLAGTAIPLFFHRIHVDPAGGLRPPDHHRE